MECFVESKWHHFIKILYSTLDLPERFELCKITAFLRVPKRILIQSHLISATQGPYFKSFHLAFPAKSHYFYCALDVVLHCLLLM